MHLPPGGSVGDVGYAFYLLVFHKVGNALHEVVLDHSVRYLGDYDLVMRSVRFDFSLCADYDSSSSGLESVAHTLHSEYLSARGEIRGFDVFHQPVHVKIRVVDKRE